MAERPRSHDRASPLVGGNDSRDEVHGQRAFTLAEGEGDPVAVEVGIALCGPLLEALGAEVGNGSAEVLVGGSRGAVGQEHLVVGRDEGRHVRHDHPLPSPRTV